MIIDAYYAEAITILFEQAMNRLINIALNWLRPQSINHAERGRQRDKPGRLTFARSPLP